MRPAIVGERTRLGDNEIDLMVGKAHKSALLVLTERATPALEKVTSRKAMDLSPGLPNGWGGFHPQSS